MSDTSTNHRKIEHIRILQEDAETDRQGTAFDHILLRHRALPEMDLKDVDSSVTLLGKKLSFPLLISSMTGGDHDDLKKMNRNLAEAAERCGVAMGVGSQRVMFTHPDAVDSFTLRDLAPNALLFGNLGAVQLNKGFGLKECEAAVEVLQADGLFLHLNPLQEAIQPEGDTCFAGLASKMGRISRELSVPVIVKEIGCGISKADAELLMAHDLRMIDVAGSGGTSWSRIEHFRRQTVNSDGLGLLFQDWGIPTPDVLKQLSEFQQNRELTLIASGGLRNALDMIKSLILGASLCGMAKPFMAPALESADAVVTEIEDLKRAFQTAMFLLGTPTLRELKDNEDLIL
ncbi:type 2 isopentenyl-diphosphate Delta-isomerase [Kiritimatiellaeota bacterium B1221]|nr:type 2 isopentenyl-diphosphate Delta-isomerase [Kiritimatiellaeota bacterium B1221]